MTTLRSRLRDDTRSAHDRLDRLVSGFDLRKPGPLGSFMAGHHAAMQALDVAPGPCAASARALLEELLPALEADLATLGRAPAPAPRTLCCDDTAALYVLLGSRLGTLVLRRRWQEARDPAVRAAACYFDRPPPTQEWRRFTAWLDAQPAETPAAERSVRDAARLFELFETTLTPQAAEVAHV